MAKLFNRAKMTTATTGSGTVTLGSASNGFQTFAAAGVSNGDVVQYVIEEGANFEIGTGTYSSSGTSLTRSPTESSNSNNAITLAGQATVSITAVAADLNRLQHGGSDKVTVSSTGASITGNLAVSGTVDGRNVASDGSKLDGIEANAKNDQTITAGGGLAGGGTGDVTLSHSDTSSQASVNNSGGTVIQDVTVDTYGHVTGLTSYNLDGRYYTETEADSRFVNVAGDTMTGHLGIGGTATDASWSDATYGNTEVSIDGGGGYGVLHFRGDGAGSTDTRYSVGVGDGIFYMAYDDVDGVHRAKINASHQLILNEGSGDVRAFHDGYHPNADAWTTSRTLTLSGEASGSVSWDGSANATLSVTLNDSALDDQYVTVGARHTGNADSLVQTSKASIRIWDVSTATDDPSGATDGLILSAGWDSSSWGIQQYHDFHSNDLYLRSKNNNSMTSWDRVFHDTYHPNADTLTTARTINGVSFNGSANITVADSTKLPLTGGTITGDLNVNGVRFRAGSNVARNLKIQPTGSDSTVGLTMFNGAGAHCIQLYGGSTEYGFLDANWGGWDIQKSKNGAFKVDEGSGLQRVFNDGYHPNADTLTTARTINGVSFNGSANITVADSTKLPLSGGTMTGTLNLLSQKINFVSGAGGSTFGSNHYQMGVDVANGAWSSPNYSDLIIGYHTGIRLGASYTGIRFYNNSPTTDSNNTGNGNGGEALIMTVGGTQGSHVNVHNNLTVGANANILGDLTANGGGGAITLNNSDIRSAQSNPTWTGNPGTVGKIQYHSNRWYIVADASSNRIVQFRRDGADKSYIDNNGDLQSGKAAGWITSRTLSLTGAVTGSVSWNGTGNATLSTSFNDNGPNYIDVATGNYGTVKVDDDRGVAWAGYAIRDDWVFMASGADQSGIYNDTDNEWAITCHRNADTRLYHNGSQSLQTVGATGIRVGSTSSSDIYMQDTDHGERRIHCNSNRIGFLNSSNGWSAYSEDAGHWVVAGNITASGNVNSQSDVRVKENIEPISDAMQKVQSINGVTFNRNDLDDTETRYVGVIAQDVEAVLPEAVSENGEGIKQVAYGNMVGLLIEAIKEQQDQINDLKAEIQSMKS